MSDVELIMRHLAEHGPVFTDPRDVVTTWRAVIAILHAEET